MRRSGRADRNSFWDSLSKNLKFTFLSSHHLLIYYLIFQVNLNRIQRVQDGKKIRKLLENQNGFCVWKFEHCKLWKLRRYFCWWMLKYMRYHIVPCTTTHLPAFTELRWGQTKILPKPVVGFNEHGHGQSALQCTTVCSSSLVCAAWIQL